MTCGLRPYARKKTFFRRAMIFLHRRKICDRRQTGPLPVSDRHRCDRRSCVQRIRTATAFYHHDYWTSWLQPYESSV